MYWKCPEEKDDALKFMRVKFSVLHNIILNCTSYENCHISVYQTSLLSCPRARWQSRDVPVGAGLMCGLSQNGLPP